MARQKRGPNEMTYGRIPIPDELRRSECVRVMITPGDKADLTSIAEAWGVPMSTAAFAMISTELATARGTSLSASIFPIEVMASVRVLAAQRKVRNQRERFQMPEGEAAEEEHLEVE